MKNVLRKNLDLLRDQGFRAIDHASRNSCRQIFARHVDFLKEYLGERSLLGLKSKEDDVAAAGLLGRESSTLELILESLVELVSAAFRSEDVEIIGVAISSVIGAQFVALDNDELSVFQRFVSLTRDSLVRGMQVADPVRRSRLVKRIWEAEESVAQYLEWHYLQGDLRGPDSLLNYVRAQIEATSAALKYALDNGLVAECDSLLVSLNTLLSAEHIGGHADFYQKVRDIKRAIEFGLGAWATKLYGEGRLSLERFFPVFAKVIDYLGDFYDLARLYLRVFSSGPQAMLAWASWEIEEQPPGQAASIDLIPSWLKMFYVLSSLKVITEPPDIQRAYQLLNVELSSVEAVTVQMIIETTRTAAAEILETIERWSPLYAGLVQAEGVTRGQREVLEERIGWLTGAWEQVLERRRADEEEALLEAPVTVQIVESFRTKLLEAWADGGVLRRLAHAFQFYEDRTQVETNVGLVKFGLNILESKRWFVPEAASALESVAENLGNNMADSESAAVFQKMIESVQPIEVNSSQEALEFLDVFIDSIHTGEIKECVAIVTTRHELLVQLLSSSKFETVHSETHRGHLGKALQGFYRGIPLVTIWVGSRHPPTGVLCGKMAQLGRWLQFPAEALGEQLHISVEMIDDAKARTLLLNNPGLRKSPTGGTLPEDDAVRSLRRKVHVQIWERFEYEPLHARAAIRIDFRQTTVSTETQG